MDILTIVLLILGSSSVTAVLAAYLNRRTARAVVDKTRAETAAIAIENRQKEADYYRKRVDEAMEQLGVLEAQVKELKNEIGRTRDEYERRIGELHTKIDSLSAELKRANASLELANKTINELRLEVKAGNEVITDLRKEISQLLVDRAEKGAA